jgi:hypothetical protein
VAVESKEPLRSTSPDRYNNNNNNNSHSRTGSDRLSNPMFAHARVPSGGSFRPLTPNTPGVVGLAVSGSQDMNPSRENLVLGAAPLGGAVGDMRQPTLPNLGGIGSGGGGYGQQGGGYGQQGVGGGPYGGGYNRYRGQGPYGGY